MVSVVLVGAVFLAAAPAAAPTSDDRAAYETARTHIGRDPDAHVKLAIWCEAHGLKPERLRHLAIAVVSDPANATARGLMGLVAYRGRWHSPQDVTEKVRADEAMSKALAEYNARRAKLANTADAHWKLALWCGSQGLKAEEFAHLSAVTRLDPARTAAWKRLGYKQHNGRWMTEAQIAQERTEAERQKQADRRWKPKLEKLRSGLAESSRAKRAAAEEALRAVTDPRAVPSVWSVFAMGSSAQKMVAVQLLGQIDSPSASQALAFLAVFSKTSEVRRIATETLKQRDPREFLALLINLLRDPIKYEVRPVNGPGSTGQLFVEGKKANARIRFEAPAVPAENQNTFRTIAAGSIALMMEMAYIDATSGFSAAAQRLGQQMAVNPTHAAALLGQASASHGGNAQQTGGPSHAPGGAAILVPPDAGPAVMNAEIALARINYNIAVAQTAAVVAQQQLASQVSAIETYNRNANEIDSLVLPVVTTVTGQDLGRDSQSWQKWWTDQQGYAYVSEEPEFKPTIETTVVPEADFIMPPVHTACFGAGTPVRTLAGPRRIESMRAGDQVLCEDTTSGELRFEPVLAVFHNKPAPALRLMLDSETIVVTGIHRFWKVGQGWAMARDLKPGDAVRTIGGVAKVVSSENQVVQPVFNLEVANGHDFFVGTAGALVHDNSLVAPVAKPFDAEPTLAGLAQGTR